MQDLPKAQSAFTEHSTVLDGDKPLNPSIVELEKQQERKGSGTGPISFHKDKHILL